MVPRLRRVLTRIVKYGQVTDRDMSEVRLVLEAAALLEDGQAAEVS